MEEQKYRRIADGYIEKISYEIPQIKGELITVKKYFESIESSLNKFLDQHEKIITKIYKDLEDTRMEFGNEIKKVNERIDRLEEKFHERLDKNENNIMGEIKNLENQITNYSESTKDTKKVDVDLLALISEWRYRIIGFGLGGWFILRNFDVIEKLKAFYEKL